MAAEVVLIIPNPINVATCWYPTSAPGREVLGEDSMLHINDLLANLARTRDGVVAVNEQQAIIFSGLALIKADVNSQILNH